MGTHHLGTFRTWATLLLAAATLSMAGSGVTAAQESPPVDLTDRVTVTTANERSSLNRRTRVVTSVADMIVTNASADPIGSPLHAVVVTSSNQVQMPEALGGPGTSPYNAFYYDLSSELGDGVLSPGESVSVHLVFVRNYRVRFTYQMQVYGLVEQGPTNLPPVADAGSDQELQLQAGQTGVQVTLDGSGSHDPDGTIAGYLWTGSPDPADQVQPNFLLGPGSYTFTLTVTDDTGDPSALDSVTVTVLDCPRFLFYSDADSDGFGDPGVSAEACVVPAGYVADSGDCDDSLGSVHPGAMELCNGLDDDCDGSADTGFPLGEPCAVGTGACAVVGVMICATNGLGTVCDAVAGQPGAETCNNVDDNCDGEVDEGVTSTFFADVDGDGFGDPGVTTAACAPPSGFVAAGSDCDDADNTIHPGAQEIAGNGIDEDCNGVDAAMHPPVLVVETTSLTIDEGNRLVFEISATDPDGDRVSLSARPMLSNATFSTVAGTTATGTFTFDPDHDQQGNFVVAITARDPLGLSNQRNIEITVNNVNRGPTLQVPSPLEIAEGGLLTVPIAAQDADGDPVTISATPLPANALLIESTGTLVFMPDFDQAGSYSITCQATDGDQVANATLQITVNDADTGSGSASSGLELVVTPVESPTLLGTARITGSVNATPPTIAQLQSSLITGLAPAVGTQGETLDVLLTGLISGPYATHFTQGQTSADFGSDITVNTLQVTAPDTLRVNLSIDPKATIGTRAITVRTGAEQALAMVSFSVSEGEAEITGRLVDPETGAPVVGATVTIQGTSITGVSGAGGGFVLTGVPTGTQTLIISAADHELQLFPVQSATGLTLELGDLPSPSTVTDPSAPPAASVRSILQRGIGDRSRPMSLDEARGVVRDALVLVGGHDIGVKDEYGNEVNPEANEVPFVSLGADTVETLARRMITTETTSLGDVLFAFTTLWEWSDGPPNLIEWIAALQAVADQAWANPNDRRYALVLLLFNPDRTLLPVPPTLIPDTPLNAFQAFLAEITLLLSATRTIDPETLHDQVIQTYPELAAATPPGETDGMLARLGRHALGVLELLVPPAHAAFEPTAKAEQNEFNIPMGQKLMLLARADVNPTGFEYEYSWTVTRRPIASNTTNSLLKRQNERIAFFKPDVSGQYTVRLIVTQDGTASNPFDEVIITASDPCDASFKATVVNADATWDEVYCVLGRTLPQKIATGFVSDGLKGFLKGAIPSGTFNAKFSAAKQLQHFITLEDFSHPQSKVTAAQIYGKNYPNILKEAQLDTGKMTAFKQFAVKQAVSGVAGFIQGQASQMAKDLMYAILDKMIDVYIKSMRPSPPGFTKVAVTDNPWDPDRKAAVISFERSPNDEKPLTGPGGLPGIDTGNINYYYILWRSSPGGGMARLFIGSEGTSLGPHPDPNDQTGKRLIFMDPYPPEGHNSYYVQTRRIIGGKTVTVEKWSEAGFWAEQFLNTASPPGANVYTHFKTFSDRAIKFLKAIKLQDSDLSEPARIYFPRPFERPKPPVSLASTTVYSVYGGGVLMGVPLFGSVFRLNQTRAQYLLQSGFKDPYQVGLAVDSKGYIYADNAASDELYGGRIFRWEPVSLNRELFGSVQYFSMLLQLSRPAAVQSMAVGSVAGLERLYVADAYSNTVRELVIPPDGALPPNPNHYVSRAITSPGEIAIRADTSMAVNEAFDELYVSSGDNILRHGSLGHGLMFPDDAKPFTSISGVAVDRLSNMYVADGYRGIVTMMPGTKLSSVFWRQLNIDPALRSLYTIVSGLINPGELRLSGDQKTLVFFDKAGLHQLLFGLSAHLIDDTGAPLVGARVTVEDRGTTTETVTDAYGVFHLFGLQIPGMASQVHLIIRTRDGRTGQAIAYLNTIGHTVVHRLEFREVTVPTSTTGPMPPPPPPPPDIPEVDLPAGKTVVIDILVEMPADLPTPEPAATPPSPLDDPTSDLPLALYVDLLSPVDGIKTGEATVEVVGRVEDPALTHATVRLNDTSETVAISGRTFRTVVSLRDGFNTLRATVTGLDTQGRVVTGTTPSIVVFRVSDAPPSGALAGTVYDTTSGYPVPGAQVKVAGTTRRAYTDGHGVWRLPDLPPGNTKIVVVP